MSQIEIPELLEAVHPLQERWAKGDPWRVLAICLLLNRTDGRVVARHIEGIFRRWPDAGRMAAARPATLEEALRPLGLHRRRARLLRRMSAAYEAGGWTDPGELPGVGTYAREAWRIFVEGDPDFDPSDRALRQAAARDRRHNRGGDHAGEDHEGGDDEAGREPAE